MPNSVLILAPETDPHAAALAWSLRRHGVPLVWAPSILVESNSHYAFHIDAAAEYLKGPHVTSFSAIWNRRLNDPKPDCAEADRKFVSWEWKMFQRNLFSLPDTYGSALWVNPLVAAQHAENKLVQLSACRRLGLAFPETVVTNDADQVDALRKKWGRIVFKSFSIHQWEDRQSGKKYAVGVPLLDQHSELPAASIAICPGIYQRYIDKICDIRVTVIGRHFFPMSLRHATSGAFVDWRTHSMDPELVAEAITLPESIENRLRALMQHLGLVFGCIDLVVDRQGEFYFLEINQAGQFLFVEDMLPQYPVLQVMTALLGSGRVDCDPAAFEPLSMTQFRASDAYAALKERAGQSSPDPHFFSVE